MWTIILLVLYLVTACLWAAYAITQQVKYYWAVTSYPKYVLVYIINFLLMPLCILAAIGKHKTW
jgi:hypothetical protein